MSRNLSVQLSRGKPLKEGATAEKLKNSMKYQIPDEKGKLFVLIGEDYVPVDVDCKFMTDGEDYAYLSFNRHASCWKVVDDENGDPLLVPMEEDEDATEMAERIGPKLAQVSYAAMNEVNDLPESVARALEREAPGFKIVYDSNGKPMLVKPKHPGRPRKE